MNNSTKLEEMKIFLKQRNGENEEYLQLKGFLMANDLYEEFLHQTEIPLKSNEELIQFFLEQNDFTLPTRKGYTSDFKYILEQLGHKNLQKVNSRDTWEFHQHLRKTEAFGVNRKKRLLACLKSFYDFFRRITKIFPGEYFFLEFPVFEKAKFKEKDAKSRSNKEVALTKEEVMDVLFRIRLYNEQDYLIALLMAGSGLRIGDVLNIKIENIDFLKRKVRTKTKTRIQDYYFSEFIKQEILQYLPHKTESLTIPYLFLNHDGERFKNTSYTRRFCRIIHRHLKYNKQVSCHTLRRSFSTIRKRLGQPKDDVSFLLGHTIRNVTDRYIKLTHEEKLAIYDNYDFLPKCKPIPGYNHVPGYKPIP